MHKQLKEVVRWLSRMRVLLFVLFFSIVLIGLSLYHFARQDNWLKKRFAVSEKALLINNNVHNGWAYSGAGTAIFLILGIVCLLLLEIRYRKKINEELRLQKEYYRITINSMGEGLITTGRQGEILYMNPAAEKLTGWTISEAVNLPLERVYEVVNEESGKHFEHIVGRILREKKLVEFENNTILHTKDRNKIIISNSGSPLFDTKGNISGTVLVFNDITENKKNESKLKESEKQYRTLIQNLPEAIYTCDAEGYIKLYNKAAIELWGKEPVSGKDVWCGSLKIFNTDGKEIPLNSCPMAVSIKEARAVYGQEIVIQRPDGSLRHVLPYPSPLYDASGHLAGAINMLIDVTEKKEKEILIKQSEEKYHSLIEQASDGILIYSFDGTIHEFNKSCYTMLGYTSEEYAKLRLHDILVDDIIVNKANYDAILAGDTRTVYRHLKRKNGSLIDTEVTVKMLADGKAIAFARDITERKKAQEIIKKEKELSDSVINSLPGVFYLFDETGKLLRWNRKFEQTSGYSAKEIANMHPLQFFRGDEISYIAERIVEVFCEGESDAYADFVTKEERKIPFYFTGLRMQYAGKPTMLGIGFDITELKNAETKTKIAVERYDILSRATSDTIWDWDIVNNKIQYNESITKMFGYQESEVESVVEWWNMKLHPDDFQNVTQTLEDIFEEGPQRFQLTYRFRCVDGSYKNIYDRAFVIYDADRRPIRMIGAMQDVTYTQEEQKRIAKAIIDAQELERRYIGQELHDNVNQILAASRLTLSVAKNIGTTNDKVKALIETSTGYIYEAIEELRKLSHRLAPATFDDMSLKEKFEDLLLSINPDNRYHITHQFDEIKEEYSSDIWINLYRILQEQIKNIISYSEANSIEISVMPSRNGIVMRIFDNGKGFDTKTSKNGIGLRNIRNRIESFCGKFILNSAPGKGCEMIVEIPQRIPGN